MSDGFRKWTRVLWKRDVRDSGLFMDNGKLETACMHILINPNIIPNSWRSEGGGVNGF